jgi:hypothetical protein
LLQPVAEQQEYLVHVDPPLVHFVHDEREQIHST